MENKDFENMSSNDILFFIKKLGIDYESTKTRMLSDFDKLVEMEKDYDAANKILLRRLKGQ